MNNLKHNTIEIVSKLRIVRAAELTKLLGISSTSLWRWRQNGDFPQPIALGSRMVGWKVIDIESWLDANKCERCTA